MRKSGRVGIGRERVRVGWTVAREGRERAGRSVEVESTRVRTLGAAGMISQYFGGLWKDESRYINLFDGLM